MAPGSVHTNAAPVANPNNTNPTTINQSCSVYIARADSNEPANSSVMAAPNTGTIPSCTKRVPMKNDASEWAVVPAEKI